jgi:Uma2 family endonuclease
MFDDTNIAINPLAVLKQSKKPRLYSLAQYLRKDESSDDLFEYYNGHIVKLPAANAPHNLIATNIGTTFHGVIRNNFRVLMGKQLVYIPTENYAFYPDVVVVKDTLQYFDYDETLVVNPVLIVEVLSKGIKRLDRTVKFREYKALDTFKEHILIDKQKCWVQVSYREEPNVWKGTDYKNINDSIYLKSIDCTISLADIYENIMLK